MSIIKKSQLIMRRLGIPAWLIFSREDDDQNSFLLLGKHLMSRHAIIVPASGKPVALIGELEAGLFRGREDFRVRVFKDAEAFKRLLKSEASRHGMIALNYATNLLESRYSSAISYLSHSEYLALRKLLPGCHFISSQKLQYELRYVKTSEEVKLHKKACSIIEEIVDGVLRNSGIKGKTEKEVAIAIENGMRIRDCEPSFRTIVASGPNSAVPHHDPTSRRIRRGDMVLIDAGASYMMRCSDISRTICVGRATELNKSVYAQVKEAQKTALRIIRPGVRAGDVNRKCDEALLRLGKGEIMHGAGHPLGLRVHDVGPSFSNTHKERVLKLQDGMIMTVEPGLYLEGKFGVRIEDDVLVSGKKGCILLTHSPEELVEI